MAHDVRVLEPAELPDAHELFYGALHFGPSDEEGTARAVASYSPGRVHGIRDGAALVATASSFPCRTAVPGGAVLAAAGVTGVGVRADHTRRGLLTALMRAQLADIAARGEVLASLRATEARIYGRFGYGVATRGQEVKVRRSGRGWRAAAPIGGSVRLVERAEIVPVLAPLYERLALEHTGRITRPESWWTSRIGRRLAAREYMVVAVHTGPDGDDGFVFAVPGESGGEFAERTLRVEDMHTSGVEATAALWRFLLGLDLIGTVEGVMRPLDEPLELLLADPRDRTVTSVEDETWLRIVDVPAALAARTYGAVEPVLLAVHDPLLEGNAGVYRIGADGAERVGPLGGPVEPELECDVAALSMAYLGDRAPSQLAATGWWRAGDPDALARADLLFATSTVPWCGTFF